MLAVVKMRLAVLGSGSGGNAMVLECGDTRILLDAGLSAKQLVRRLGMLGVDPESLNGIVLTHEHSDHARGIDVFLRRRRVPVFANAMTREALQWGCKSEISWKVFNTGQAFGLGGMEVLPFPIPHDAAEPVGFTIEAGGTRFGMVTDVGYVTQAMRVHLRGSDALFVESNYDEGLLEADTRRPWATKQRIASRHGHLSNTQAGELISDVGCERLKGVMLGHLSGDCNCPILAGDTVRGLLSEGGLRDVKVHCATQDEPSEWVEFGAEASPMGALDGELFQPEMW